MANEEGPRDARAVLAFSVHVFTASGAALALLALVAAVRSDWTLMFIYLGAALFIDGIDGTFARHLKVAERLPRWSGDTLDLVVDFTTYVFVPAFAVLASGLMPLAASIPAAIVIVVTGALYFADRNMKMTGNYFRGFPATWNAVVFYLFLLRPDPLISVAVIMVLAVATFIPIPFVHPFRVRRLMGLNVALIVVWSVLAVLALWRDMEPGPFNTGALCAIALYFLGAGLLRRAE